jgi:hypothetical protein
MIKLWIGGRSPHAGRCVRKKKTGREEDWKIGKDKPKSLLLD